MNEKLMQQWKKDEKVVFKGWNFSYIKKRIIQPNPPWSYEKIAKKLMKKSKSVLDMGTGGGEVFASLKPFPKKACAIEGYKPNITIARKKLKPFGVKVLKYSNPKKIPFKEEEFDLILNRHEALNAEEVYRILKKGGIFLTQQVDGSKDLKDLVKEFKSKRKFIKSSYNNIKRQVKEAGFKIKKSRSWQGKTTFKDVGAIVYYLKAIPWIVQEFSVRKYKNALIKLQKKLEKRKKLLFIKSRFMILAKK